MTRLALVQLDLTRDGPSTAVAPRSITSARSAVGEAARAGAGLVMLPELWRSGPFELAETLDHAEPATGGETLTLLRGWAREHKIWLHGGSVLTWSEPQGGSRAHHNTSYLINPSGEVIAAYRKRHLFGFDEGEAALLTAGDDIVVVDTPLGPTGLATCYDLRFPEHFRALVDAGAETVLVPAGWPEARIAHWRTLTEARAIENQMWVVAGNAAGSSGSVELGGSSLAVDPWGRIAGCLGQSSGLLLVDVDPGLPQRVRAEFPVLRDRRPSAD